MDVEHSKAKTLGQRLDALARRMAAHPQVEFAWVEPATRLLDHVATLAIPLGERFQRGEGRAGADGPQLLRPAARREPHLASQSDHFPVERAEATPRQWPEPFAQGLVAAEGEPLTGNVRSQLADTVGAAAVAVRVHTDEAADAVATAHGADAVTMGRDVFFRRGRFRPRESEGFGLLVHEATHVMQFLRPGAAWHRATAAGVVAEEQEALAREGAALEPPGTGSPAERFRYGGSAASRPDDGFSHQGLGLSVPRGHGKVSGVHADSMGGSAPLAFGVERGHSPLAAEAVRPFAGASPAPIIHGPAPVPAATAATPALRPMPAATDRAAGLPQSASPGIDLEALRRGLIRDLMQQLRTEFERGG